MTESLLVWRGFDPKFLANLILGNYAFGPGAFNNDCDAFHFWSAHPGGAHFLLVDGSVRFFSYTADPLLPALATRAGGEAVSAQD